MPRWRRDEIVSSRKCLDDVEIKFFVWKMPRWRRDEIVSPRKRLDDVEKKS